MASVVLKNKEGSGKTYENVNAIQLNTPDGGKQTFTAGEADEKTVDADFSGGNMEIAPNNGKLLTKVTINKPTDLKPGNILDGASIAGVDGEIPINGTIESEIQDKSERIEITAGYYAESGYVGLSAKDQAALIPANLRKGIRCLGVDGQLEEGSGGGGEQPTVPKETLLYENANASGFAYNDSFKAYTLTVSPAPFTMSYGKAYRVIWDGEEYLVATQPFVPLNAIAVGDLTGDFGGTGNGEPFVFGYVPAQNAVIFAGLDENTSHSITVYEITDNECKCETPIFAVDHMDGFTQAEGVTPAVYQRIVTVGQVFSETEIPSFLTVKWDGVSYACPVYSMDGMIFAGNSRFLDSTTNPDTRVPFGIVFVGQTEQMTVLTTDPGTEHSVAIYSEVVECNGSGNGGGGGANIVASSGSFTPTDLAAAITVTHGLGVIPDLIIVRCNTFVGEKKTQYALTSSAALYDKVVSSSLYDSTQQFYTVYLNVPMFGGLVNVTPTVKGHDLTDWDSNTVVKQAGLQRNITTTSFVFGGGTLYSLEESSYSWIAIGGLV